MHFLLNLYRQILKAWRMGTWWEKRAVGHPCGTVQLGQWYNFDATIISSHHTLCNWHRKILYCWLSICLIISRTVSHSKLSYVTKAYQLVHLTLFFMMCITWTCHTAAILYSSTTNTVWLENIYLPGSKSNLGNIPHEPMYKTIQPPPPLPNFLTNYPHFTAKRFQISNTLHHWVKITLMQALCLP